MEDAFSTLTQRIRDWDGPGMILLAVDGRCASGKTTLAAALERETGCNVIHMDHFFLRPEQRTRDRLEEPGGNVDYERFQKEVMLPLSRREAFSYQIFDCRKMALSSFVEVDPHKPTVIEGSYSCHPAMWDFYDLRVFLNIGREEQLRRILQRNGEEGLAQFQNRWIPMEEKYFAAFRIQERCDLAFQPPAVEGTATSST